MLKVFLIPMDRLKSFLNQAKRRREMTLEMRPVLGQQEDSDYPLLGIDDRDVLPSHEEIVNPSLVTTGRIAQ